MTVCKWSSIYSDVYFFVLQLVLCGALVNVVLCLYDYSGMTLEALVYQAERATAGRRLQSIGIITGGNSEEIHLIEGALCLVIMLNGVIMYGVCMVYVCPHINASRLIM